MQKSVTLSLVTTILLLGNSSNLDTVTVTASKFERYSKKVPQSISVVDSKAIEEKNILNVKDALETIPGVIATGKNHGYDSRLIIRGSGLKARYGIREIMVMRDGVPMTDPDSFTRMDFIDTNDIENIEVFKGPGSIYAANTAGGVVYIKSKSVFDTTNNRFKIGYGNFSSLNTNLSAHYKLNKKNYLGLTLTHKKSSNSWRQWNKFDTTQFSLKHGYIFSDDSTLETEFSYSKANLELPGSIGKKAYKSYLKTGKTYNTPKESPWVKSGRYSKSYFVNMRYEKQFENLLFKPQLYFTKWEHYHPVTGMINDSKNNYVMGSDLAFDYTHQLFGKKANLVFGLTGRLDKRDKSKKYQYKDYVAARKYGKKRIIQVTSDKKGALANIENAHNTLLGVYMQETFSPLDKLQIDFGLRYDKLKLKTDGQEITRYDYRKGNYTKGRGIYRIEQTFNLISPKIGATYAINDTTNIYAQISSANQAPTDNELRNNRAYNPNLSKLKESTSINYEIGLKKRGKNLSIDFATYYNIVKNEIVAVPGREGATFYRNAGRTRKVGAELSANYFLNDNFNLGFNASWYNYKYSHYISSGKDYSGNRQRYIPKYQFSLFAGYHKNGLSAHLETLTYGSYYIDDANTEKYKGFKFVTNLSLAYQKGRHKIQLNINNLFNKHYANEVKKRSYGRYTKYYYTPASPRSIMLTYSYQF